MPLEVVETTSSVSPPSTSSDSGAPPNADAVVADAAQANQSPGGLAVVTEVKPNPKSFEALRASRAERLAKMTPPSEGVANGAANNAGDKQVQVSQTTNNPPAPSTVKVPIEADRLDAFVKLNTELREKDALIRDLSSKATAFERFQQYEALVKAGKHVEAARFIGFDMDKANMEILGASPEPQVDPRVEALEREIAALKANDQSRQASEISEAREAGKQATIEHVKANAAEFPLLAKREKWVDAALSRAQRVHDETVQKEKRTLTMAEKDAIVLKALQDEEAERAEDLKAFSVAPNDQQKGSGNQSSQGSTGQMTITNANRGPVSNPGSTSKKKMSFEEVKRMRREAQN